MSTTKIKLTIGRTLENQFALSLDALCQDTTISAKDRYALARTVRDIKSHLDTFYTQRMDTFKRLGKPEIEIKTLMRDRETDPAKKETLTAAVKELEGKKSAAWMVDPQDATAVAALNTEIDELRKVEFEIFLDHQIILTDACKLSAKDIEALIDLVTVE